MISSDIVAVAIMPAIATMRQIRLQLQSHGDGVRIAIPLP
jgi:hypothetical protein